METTTTKAVTAQGAGTEKERKPSKLYAMKSFKAACAKLEALEMISKEDKKALDKINNALLNSYLICSPM